MMIGFARPLVAAALLIALGAVSAQRAPRSDGPSLIGIDHIPTVVADLERASDTYRRIGFSLKPGRAHENGLRNNHIKFKDGSGIELITVPAAPTDELTRSYSEFLRAGEGPAYLSFHARDTSALIAALNAANIEFDNTDGLITLGDPNLDFVFFVNDNRSPNDKPEHFAHSNGAVAMTEVWLALDTPTLESLRRLLLSLGSVEHTETVMTPTRARADVFYLQNGRVVAVSKDHQLIAGREIIGAKFRVVDRESKEGGGRLADEAIKPSISHGLWLQCVRQP